jgi:hypothetical protein
MPITLTCRHCDQALTAPDELAGNRALCAYCQMPVKVETPTNAPVSPSSLPASSAKPTVRGAIKPGAVSNPSDLAVQVGRRVPWTPVLAASLLATVGLGVAAHLFRWDPALERLTGNYSSQSSGNGSDFSSSRFVTLSDGSGTQTGWLGHPGQEDYYRFVAPRTGPMRITVEAQSGNLDPELWVYDSTRHEIAHNDNQAMGNFNSEVKVELRIGQTYYVKVSVARDASSHRSSGNYLLSFGNPTSVVNPFEDAESITLSPWGGGIQSGRISLPGETRVYRFSAPVSGRMTIQQCAATRSKIDSYLYVYDAAHREMASNDDAEGMGLDSQVVITVISARTYYVKATASPSAKPDQRTGDFTLKFSTGGAPASRPPLGATGFLNARQLTLSPSGSGIQIGKIERAGDADFYRFTAPVSGTMKIRQRAGQSSQLDSYLYVYDSNQRELANNDDAPELGLDSEVAILVVAGRTYFIKATASATAQEGRKTGAYALILETRGP